jgi:hypothetical protein
MSDDAFEIEHGHAEYEAAELLEQAQANAQALLLGTVAFLRDQGIGGGEWAAALGESFGKGWGEPRPWEAAEFLDAMLTNYRALGAEVLAVRLGAELAEATLGPFPDPDLCALVGVAPGLADAFHDAPAAIAAPRGLLWRWVRDGADVHLLVERSGNPYPDAAGEGESAANPHPPTPSPSAAGEGEPRAVPGAEG